jgi:hypothetical protein
MGFAYLVLISVIPVFRLRQGFDGRVAGMTNGFLSPAGDAGQEIDFGVGGKGCVPGVAVNPSVDGYGDAALEMGFEAGIFLAQFPEEFADIFCLDRNRGRSTDSRPERPPEMNFNHRQFLSAPIAFNTRGGDMGICVMRTPAAFDMALAMAASGGTIEVSPTPRTP